MKSQLKDLRRFNIAIPVPIPDFQALSDYMERTSRREEIGELAGQAIRRWLAQQAAEENRKGQTSIDRISVEKPFPSIRHHITIHSQMPKLSRHRQGRQHRT